MNSISINPNDRIATINPKIYGHFAEHLGRCIYDGIWVGEDSPIPNTGGFRNDLIAALRKMKPSVIRWPGGCFADGYHWKDGIGPRAERPRRVNVHWGEVIETNQVGTQEFIRFCWLVGAEPYICGNVGSGSPAELQDWVEYCNFPGDSTWARQRAADGSPDPLNVTHWGIGNENWGFCGGNFSPEDYCTEFRRYGAYVNPLGGKKLTVIACGPSQNDIEWTNRFFRKLYKDYWGYENIHGYAAHYYCGTAGTATQYTEDEWYRLLYQALQVEPLVVQQRAAMDAYDPQRRIGLVIDEWGAWHPVEVGANPLFLYQQNTVRDALVAATTLDIFNRHADKVMMANIAQTVNVLQAMVLTEGDKMLVTPTGHVYAMYAPHQGGEALRTLVETGSISIKRREKDVSVPFIAASASLKGNVLFLTITNSQASQAEETVINLLGGASVIAIQASVLSGEIHAHNTFTAPETVTAQPLDLLASGSTFTITLPSASVMAVAITLA